MKATRDGYGEAIVELAKKNKRVVALCADLTPSVRLDAFEKKFPKRFFQCGVAEANMIGMAAGLALEGKIAFASSFGVFVPNRCLDHIRQSVCYNNVNVKIVSTHCGIITGPDGATHQALEDVAIMRALPRMTVIVPCDYAETKKAIHAVAKIKGPCYVRLTRAKTEPITNKKSRFKLGKCNVLKQGKDVAIIACGPILAEALKAADKLSKERIKAMVINCHTIKPIDKAAIISAAKKTKAIVTVEDHQITGGLGGAVAEVLAENYPTKMARVGVKDSFGESGSDKELMRKYGLTSYSIVRAVKSVLKRK